MFILPTIVLLALAQSLDDLSLTDDELWDRFQHQYRQGYGSGELERRRAVFQENLEKVRQWNVEQNATFVLNEFADQTFDEFQTHHARKTRPGAKRHTTAKRALPFATTDTLPETLNYCGSHVVANTGDKVDYCGTTTTDQGTCGSCYAMGVAQLMQIHYAMLGGRREAISTQQILDCSGGFSKRCCGGIPQDVLDNHFFFVGEKDYPYEEVETEASECSQRTCLANKTVLIRQDGYINFDNCYDKQCVKRTLAEYGPFLSSMHVEERLQYYSGGILRLGCTDPNVATNHVIVVVGYGVEDGVEYLTVRNSWGNTWGEDGFFRITFDSLCGIGGNDGGTLPTSVVVKSSVTGLAGATYANDVAASTQETRQHKSGAAGLLGLLVLFIYGFV